MNPFLALLYAILLLAPAAHLQAEPVSLRKLLGAEAPGWLDDFHFDLAYNHAQSQKVEVYSMNMKRDHVRKLRDRKLPWISGTTSADEQWVIGQSKGWWGNHPLPPQPIFGYRITDPAVSGPKPKVVLTGSNHPREDPACWTLHGMVEFLVSHEKEAAELRKAFEFLVYPVINPDGKLYFHSDEHRAMREFRSVNGNPELSAAGESNHNRIWLSEGRFSSIDVVKTALRKDTEGGPLDYLLDFHGIPLHSYAFVDEKAASSPLGRVLRGRGLNLRRSEEASKITTLRSWAASDKGLKAGAALTPEWSHDSMLNMLTRGRELALAFHDVINNKPPVHHQAANVDQQDAQPPVPVFSWLHQPSELPPEHHKVALINDGPFSRSDAVSLDLLDSSSYVHFEPSEEPGLGGDLTVALWLKSKNRPQSTRYLLSRYQPRGDQRSWALFQIAASTELQLTLSADGSHDRDQIKRYLTTVWPEMELVSNQWQHLAFTFKSGKKGHLRMYLNGVELQMGLDTHAYDDSPVPALFEAGLPLNFGALDGSKNAFEGQISEVAVWNQPLPPEAILWLCRNSLSALKP